MTMEVLCSEIHQPTLMAHGTIYPVQGVGEYTFAQFQKHVISQTLKTPTQDIKIYIFTIDF